MAYKIYVADSLYYKAHGQMLVKRLTEIINPPARMPEATQEQIINKLVKEGGITLV